MGHPTEQALFERGWRPRPYWPEPEETEPDGRYLADFAMWAESEDAIFAELHDSPETEHEDQAIAETIGRRAG